ncbi:MAG: alpha/beta hydrolase [Pseudomonadota bacterium]
MLTALILIVGLIAALFAFSKVVGKSAEIALPANGKITAVRGAKIHWVEMGQGDPLVMIHGLGGNLRHFTYRLAPLLAATHRVIVIDRPGCGWSERDGETQASLPEQARIIADFLEAEGIASPTLVGHSLGGAVSLTVALNHPDRVGALALIAPDTQPIAETPEVFKGLDIASPTLRGILAWTISQPLGLLLERKIFGEIYAPEPVQEDAWWTAGYRFGRRGETFISTSEDLVQSRASVAEIQDREDELHCPIGVLYGDSDNILDPALHGGIFAEKSGAHLEMLAGKGHMLPMTAPARCAAFVREIASLTSAEPQALSA